jgi:hypothetical protein
MRGLDNVHDLFRKSRPFQLSLIITFGSQAITYLSHGPASARLGDLKRAF